MDPATQTHHELRVHGVAGTPPESMLQLVPAERVPDDGDPDAEITEWRQPPHRAALRAWSWRSLTSGQWYQAFYLVLLPFMLANLAGWMLLAGPAPAAGSGPRSLRVRVCVLLVRLVGLLVTAIFVLWTQLVVADLVAFQWLVRLAGRPGWTIGAGTLATAAVLGGVVWLSRIRVRREIARTDPWTVWTDPVGTAALHHHQSPMWNSPGINVGLRRLHLSGALSVIALVAAWPSGADGLAAPWQTVQRTGFGLAVGGLAVVAVLTAWISLADGSPPDGLSDRAATATGLRGRGLPPAVLVRRGSWPVPALAVGCATLATLGVTPAWVAARPILPALRGSALWLTAAVLAGVALLTVAGLFDRDRGGLRVANAPGVALLAAALGAALGAGIAEQVSRLLTGRCPGGTPCLVIGDHVEWMAIAFVSILATTLPAAGLAWVVVRRTRRADGTRPRGAVAARALSTHGSWVTALLGALGFLAAATGVVVTLLRGGLPPAGSVPLPVAAAVVTVLVAAVVLAVAARVRSHRPAPGVVAVLVVAAAVVAAATAVAVRHGWSVELLGIPVPPPTFAAFALAAALVVPTLVLLRRMYAGATSPNVRRGVGVLWDVGTFWPRWFHPFAPPTYSDRAVTGLIARIEDAPGRGEDVLLVAAHSQGSVIAAAALLDADIPDGIALLTFGSPWSHLYGEFFPAYVDAAATAALLARLAPGPRWRNLYRDTDPVGGAISPEIDVGPLPDVHDRVHSDYWLEPAYGEAVDRLLMIIRRSAEPGREHPPDPRR